MTDGLLIVLGVILMLLGVAGCLLPALPGPPLAYAGLLALHLTARVAFSARTLAFGLALIEGHAVDFGIADSAVANTSPPAVERCHPSSGGIKYWDVV